MFFDILAAISAVQSVQRIEEEAHAARLQQRKNQRTLCRLIHEFDQLTAKVHDRPWRWDNQKNTLVQ